MQKENGKKKEKKKNLVIFKNSNSHTYRLLYCNKAMAHPPSGSPIPAYVGKALFVVSVWCAEWHFLYRLVYNQTLETRGMLVQMKLVILWLIDLEKSGIIM